MNALQVPFPHRAQITKHFVPRLLEYGGKDENKDEKRDAVIEFRLCGESYARHCHGKHVEGSELHGRYLGCGAIGFLLIPRY